MASGEKDLKIERLGKYSDEMAAAIGQLMSFLTSRSTGEPIPEEELRAIIESPEHEQIIAVLQGQVVGSAVLNIIRGNVGEKAWLEDFVTDPEVRGQGAGHKMWLEMLRWCQERGIESMEFTSNPSRVEAHAFYAQHGAEQMTTTPFEVKIPPQD